MLPVKNGYKVKVVPFEPKHGQYIYQWFYDYRYQFFFREFISPLTGEACEHFNDVMATTKTVPLMIENIETGEVMGMMTYQNLKRKAGVVRIGILLDEDCQHKTYCIEALIIIGDFLYNRLDYKKLVIEFLESDKHIHRIATQGGWIKEATLVRESVIDDEYVDEARYYMFKETYEELYGKYFST